MKNFPICSAVALLLATCGAASAAITATFEGYTEGSLGSSFTDSASGFSFSGATYGLGATGFVAEYGDIPNHELPPILPGTVLSGVGFTPGPGFGLGAMVSFSTTSPILTNRFEMDVVYGASSSVSLTLTGFAANGQKIAQQAFDLPASSLTFSHIVFDTATPIQRVVTTTTGNFGVGYDNISVPEPASAAIVLVAGFSLILRRNIYRHKSPTPFQ